MTSSVTCENSRENASEKWMEESECIASGIFHLYFKDDEEISFTTSVDALDSTEKIIQVNYLSKEKAIDHVA
jgi:hypothetical protein